MHILDTTTTGAAAQTAYGESETGIHGYCTLFSEAELTDLGSSLPFHAWLTAAWCEPCANA
jgi:hypothetical protein